MDIFSKDFSPEYGNVVQVSPLVRRLVAKNPSPFTYYGTGTYIIGTDKVAIIDPGPLLDSHLDALKAFCATVEVSHILVTHNHMDHSPAATPLKEITGAEIYAYEVSGQIDDDSFSEEGRDKDFIPDHLLQDGDVIEGDGWTLDVLHTPGHLSNHLCFSLGQEKSLFSGDHVMGWSTSVVTQPNGDMKDYMASLERLLTRDDEIYYPTHGAPISHPTVYVSGLIAHRQNREKQIVDVLKGGACNIEKIVKTLYHNVPTQLHAAATAGVLSHLIFLIEKGQATCQGAVNYHGIYALS